MHVQKNLSIVIPSLGGKKLESTLHKVYKNKIRPLETIICIPKSLKKKIIISKKLNPKIVYTNIKGQVHQRIAGFKKAKGKYILQLDDDIDISYKSLNKMLAYISKYSNIAISPVLVDKKTNISPFDKIPENFFFKIYHFILNGKKGFLPGSISKAGVPYGYNLLKKNVSEVEWLPGGCILHKNTNLVKKNYFKFNIKKAYCEDLFHSFYLKKKNIKLLVDPKIRCEYENFKVFSSLNYKEALVLLLEDLKIRFFFILLVKKNIIRMIFFYCILFLRLNIIFLKKIFK